VRYSTGELSHAREDAGAFGCSNTGITRMGDKDHVVQGKVKEVVDAHSAYLQAIALLTR
jgi:hypothetical protein